MKTSITIDMPEVALFDSQELRLKINNYIKGLVSKKLKEASTNKKSVHQNWKQMTISPAIKAMTFDDRVDLGTTNYDELLEKALEERYL